MINSLCLDNKSIFYEHKFLQLCLEGLVSSLCTFVDTLCTELLEEGIAKQLTTRTNECAVCGEEVNKKYYENHVG